MKFFKLLMAAAAAFTLAACADNQKAKTPIYAWEGINESGGQGSRQEGSCRRT